MKRPWKTADTLCLLFGILLLLAAAWRLAPREAPSASVTVLFRTQLHHPTLQKALSAMDTGAWDGVPVEGITATVSPKQLLPSQTGALRPLPSALEKEATGSFSCRGAWRDGCFFAGGSRYLAPGMQATLSNENAVFWVEILSILPNSP